WKPITYKRDRFCTRGVREVPPSKRRTVRRSEIVVPSGRHAITVGAHNQPQHFVSDAGAGLIRPFQLNRIIPDLFGLPGADVADLTLNVVVPALSRDRVRY